MNQTYPIWQDDMIIGEAQVSKKGLYYHIRCTCKCCCDSALRVNVQCGNQKADLGILIPEAGVYTANTRIAVTKLGAEELHFFIQSKHAKNPEPLVRITSEEPFAYISDLENIRFRKENGLSYAQLVRLDHESVAIT